MKKTFKLNNLDCANCAAKMEALGKEVPGVTALNINFMTQKMKLEAPDDQFEKVLDEVVEVMHRFEPDCTVVR